MKINSGNGYFKKEITLDKEEEIKIVKIGFSWITFFFGFLVPFYRKDWKTGWIGNNGYISYDVAYTNVSDIDGI